MKNGSTKSKNISNKVEKEIPTKLSNDSGSVSTQTAIVILVIIFISSILSLALVYSLFPEVEDSEKQFIKLPRDIEDAKGLGIVLSRYKDKYFLEVLGGVFITYIL